MPAVLRVEPSSGQPWHGRLTLDLGGRSRTFPCALGSNGIVTNKREGDGGTPAGRYPLRRLFYQAGRLENLVTQLPQLALEPHHGWCDDPASPAYNRFVRLPYPGSHEHLWRLDAVYDLIVTLGHNDAPPVPGRGSAIFMHVAKPGYGATEGCVALSRPHLLEVLRHVDAGTMMEITGGA